MRQKRAIGYNGSVSNLMSNTNSRPRTTMGFAILAALALCCLIVGVVSFLAGRQSVHERQATSFTCRNLKKCDPIPQQSDDDRAGIPAFVEYFVSNPAPLNIAERENRALSAQEISVFWAFIATIISIIQILVSIFGIWALMKTIHQGKDSLNEAKEANKISINSKRPWVKIDVPSITLNNLDITMQSLYINTKIQVINTGESTALI